MLGYKRIKLNDKYIHLRKQDNHTIFIVNLPLNINRSSLYSLFSKFGDIDSIDYSNKQNNLNKLLDIQYNLYRNIHLKYKEAESTDKLLELDRFSTSTDGLNLLDLYKSNRIDHNDIKQFTIDYMNNFDDKPKTRNDNSDKMEDDGFTLVERGGKHGKAANVSGVQVSSKLFNPAENTKKSKFNKPLDDFYRWQRRESKRQEIAGLRLRFQKDKLRIDNFKSNKRYKPY